MISVNVNGVRTKKKRLLLEKLLEELKVGVCILTETHLRKRNLGGLRIPGYHVLGDYCREPPAGARIGGGVVILVYAGFSAERLDDTDRELLPYVEHCSVRFFPTTDPCTEMRITGVYIPPSQVSSLTIDRLMRLTPFKKGVSTGDRAPQLLAGDFNTTEWGQLYMEWTQEAGLQELVNPETPTFALGSSLDKLLFLPGYYIPSTFLPPGESRLPERDSMGEEPYYPAMVLDYPHLSDHSPILLPLPSDSKDPEQPATRRLRVGHLSKEEWEERDANLSALLARTMPDEVPGLVGEINVAHYHAGLIRAINKVLAGEQRRTRENRSVDPFGKFLLAHAEHPKMNALLEALESNQREKSEYLISRMSADGWKKHLKEVSLSDTRSLFAYLAKSEGRKPWGFVPGDSSPLVDERGRLVLAHSEKVKLLTKAVSERFTASRNTAAGFAHGSANDAGGRGGEHPLGAYRGRMQGDLVPVTRLEVNKAISSLTSGKTPGPDGLPTEVLKNLNSLVPYLATLFTGIFKSGSIPEPLRRVHMVMINKPGKDPRDPNSKRPISLINVIMKMLESVIYHRMLPVVEPHLHPNQYAYRRARGTEHHLVSMLDGIHRALLLQQNVYVISFDIAGAFDTVSHSRLLDVMEEFGIDSYTGRLVRHWIIGRTFVVKYRTPQGVFYGQKTPIKAGLPQGGVLSPFLWLMFFNGIHGELKALRELRGEDPSRFVDLVFADDLTTIIFSPELDPLRGYSHGNVDNVRHTMGRRGLNLQDPKTHNILFRPEVLPKGIFRRAPPLSNLSTKVRRRNQYMVEARHSNFLLTDLDPMASEPLGPAGAWSAWGFPYPLSEEMKVLGITLDPHLTLDAHHRGLLSKAMVRQSILARVAHTTWGLDATVLRVTHDALINSLLRYGLVFTGTCLPDDLLNKLDTGVINIAARRISGLPRIARIEALHFVSGTHSSRNLYAQHCGNFLHLVLTSHASGIRERVRRELQVLFGIPSLDLAVQILKVDLEASFIMDSSGVPMEVLQRLRWMANHYRIAPNWKGVEIQTSVFCVNAPELRQTSRGRELAYSFRATHSWLDVALQVLFQVGWRPECSQPHTANVKRALPPEATRANFYPGQYPDKKDKIVEKDGKSYKASRIKVVCGVLRVDEVFATVVVLSANGVVLQSSGFVHGVGFPSITPAYVHEAAVLHGVRVLREWVGTIEQYLLHSIEIIAGNALVSYQITEWMRSGSCRFQTSAASGLIADLQSMGEWLHTDTFLHPFCLREEREEMRGETEGGSEGDSNQELLLRLAEHFRTVVLPQQGAGWTESLPRLPLTTEELKSLLSEKEQADEMAVLRELAAMGSTSAEILAYLQVTRPVIKEALAQLCHERQLQTNLAGILCATRFKILVNGRVYHTKCPKTMCYSKDSFGHLLECYSLQQEVLFGPDAVPFLVKMARTTVLPRGKQRIPYFEEYHTEYPRETTPPQEGESVRNEGETRNEE